MNIPEEIKIGWQTYKIIEIEPKEDLITASERFYGQILYEKSKILLKADVSKEQKRNTLLHEIIHAVDAVRPPNFGLKLLNSSLFTVLL